MNNDKFQGEVAIVTGAGQGIGFEIARRLSASGASVLLNDVDESLAKTASEKIIEDGNHCIAIGGDASDVDFIQHMVDEAVKQFGKISLGVANAGLSLYGNFFDYTKEDFQKAVNLNLQGSFFLAQRASRQMIKQRTRGSILFMSSVVGHQALKDLAAYAMTKAGLEMLAKNLVADLAKYGITSNAIAPGATLTERTLGFEDYEAEWSRLTPTGRAATVTDIANVALFLLSKEASHITGQTIIVDGGWTSISPAPPNR